MYPGQWPRYSQKSVESLKEINKEYSAGLHEGKFRILYRGYYLTKQAFTNFLANKRIEVSLSDGISQTLPASKAWLEWEGRKTFN